MLKSRSGNSLGKGKKGEMPRSTGRRSPAHAMILLALLLAGGCRTLPPALDLAYQRGGALLQVTSLGHATFLLELQGRLILTDPWFYETPFTGRHPEPLGLAPERLPPLDLILVTHPHIDHFDKKALKQMKEKTVPLVCVPGMGTRVRKLGFSQIIELKPWETVTLGPLTITAVPAAHYGPANGYIIGGEGKVLYFAGETTFFPELRQIAKRFPRIDIAFLPADGLKLRWGRKLAMDPEEAAEAVKILHPKVVIPILGHDFSRSLAGLVLKTTGTVEGFKALVERRSLDVKVIVLRPGSTWRQAEGEP